MGVELVALGMHFENCGSLCAPVPGLLLPLGIDVELGQDELLLSFFLSLGLATKVPKLTHYWVV